eukprot:UN10486
MNITNTTTPSNATTTNNNNNNNTNNDNNSQANTEIMTMALQLLNIIKVLYNDDINLPELSPPSPPCRYSFRSLNHRDKKFITWTSFPSSIEKLNLTSSSSRTKTTTTTNNTPSP